MDTVRTNRFFKTLSVKEKAALYASLIREPGWQLLKQTFQPEMRTRISDVNTKESFLYEAIRAQVIQEIFAFPLQVIYQMDRDYADRLAQTLIEPMSPIDAAEDFLTQEDSSV